jgi:allantoicase
VSSNRLDDIAVQVRLTRDHQATNGVGETVPAGTWVDGWLDPDTRRHTAAGRGEYLLRYTVRRDGHNHNHLAHFEQDHIRRATGPGMPPRRFGATP